MKARTPKRHGSRGRAIQAEQLPLFAPRKPHGGKRRNAGRPPKGLRAGSPHRLRPQLASRFPVHVVLRVTNEVGNLRRARSYRAIRTATLVTSRRESFQIVHLSIQRTHVHLIVEAENKRELARGMQGFQISTAKQLNAAISLGQPGPRRRGRVFLDRYHAEVITTPKQARNTLSYVMNNWRKHCEDRADQKRTWRIDWFSSAALFPDWLELSAAQPMWRMPTTYEPLLTRPPRTWLLRVGWKRHGLISYCEVPGRPETRRC